MCHVTQRAKLFSTICYTVSPLVTFSFESQGYKRCVIMYNVDVQASAAKLLLNLNTFKMFIVEFSQSIQ